ncbi:hypothetical protein GDO78_015965 [Eleutherodactylus coqui]|uniref:Ig-like domain-containing protein n=1 Tax=Eleutherodactylus coqui TaxID=57060 RepID=A0A8J6E682_ELECQ|nr:hypothetical protein GDO78_015965 [Eleutherodactylus coqui]
MLIVPTVLLSTGKGDGQTVNQTWTWQNVPSGQPILLECTYKVSVPPNVFWYVQYPGKEPLMLVNDQTQKTNKGFSVIHDKKKNSLNLKKENVEVTDSGVYFCAVSDTVNKPQGSPVT